MDAAPKRRFRIPWLIVGALCGFLYGDGLSVGVREHSDQPLFPLYGMVIGLGAGLALDALAILWRRTRFQFSLATWLILVAILCWAMTMRPYWTEQRATLNLEFILPRAQREMVLYSPNPDLPYPFLALVGLVAWKGVSALQRRRAARNSEPLAA